jgi:hypothetical protein
LTNLLIPADVVSLLRIPDVAVSTGEPGGVWCDRTWGRWRLSRRHVVRLPYDVAAAAKLRKRAVSTRVYAIFLPAYLLFVAWNLSRPEQERSSSPWPMIMSVGLFALSVLDSRWNVAPVPSRTGRGDLYLPGLPPAVAQLWLESNPGVQAVDREPTYRRWPPRVYAAGALLCAAIAVGLVVWLFSGVDVSLAILFVLPALVIAALTLAYRTLPTGHTRLNGAP